MRNEGGHQVLQPCVLFNLVSAPLELCQARGSGAETIFNHSEVIPNAVGWENLTTSVRGLSLYINETRTREKEVHICTRPATP